MDYFVLLEKTVQEVSEDRVFPDENGHELLILLIPLNDHFQDLQHEFLLFVEEVELAQKGLDGRPVRELVEEEVFLHQVVDQYQSLFLEPSRLFLHYLHEVLLDRVVVDLPQQRIKLFVGRESVHDQNGAPSDLLTASVEEEGH